MVITTQSGKDTINPFMSVVDKDKNNVVDVYEAPKEESKRLVNSGESSQKLMTVDKIFEFELAS